MGKFLRNQPEGVELQVWFCNQHHMPLLQDATTDAAARLIVFSACGTKKQMSSPLWLWHQSKLIVVLVLCRSHDDNK